MEEKLILCPLFQGVALEEIAVLFQETEHKILTFAKNEMVVAENDICNKLMVVMKGTVRGEMTDYSGKIIKIEDIETYRPLAPAFLFGMKNKFPVTILANEKVEILIISQDEVLRLFQKNVTFLSNFLNMISNRAQFLSQKIKFLSFQTIKGKLAHYLLQFDKQGDAVEFILPASQKALAELFGVTRPALSRAIRELNQNGLIEANGRNIKILNRQKLTDLLR